MIEIGLELRKPSSKGRCEVYAKTKRPNKIYRQFKALHEHCMA